MFNDLLTSLKVFVSERGWLSYHSPRNMATTLAVETSELLEHFLPGATFSQEELIHELGDVLHCILLTMESLCLEPPVTLPEYKSSGNLPLELSTKLRTFMDHFSWLENGQLYRGELSELKTVLEELLAIHLLLCKELHIDPFKASAKKLEHNRKKYPVDLVKGSVENYYIRKKKLYQNKLKNE